ncbi:MAG: glycoside hydrolase family 13 protein [Defluviitaleaceae bacterium]|nr:glycoside hydrolase family 13 protein [Defluviitaleaceae bacterium]
MEAIYLNPVFVSPSSHKYDAQDYDYIDPHFGVILEDGGDLLRFEHVDNKYATKYKKRTTQQANLEAGNRLMIELIEKAHAHGIKVIMDGVFNHCGSFHKWLDAAGFYKGEGAPGAYWAADSPFHNYFVWHGSKPTDYAGWWDNANHPKLNYEDSPALFEYMMEVGKKWVSPPYNADGWRLDVAADLGRSLEMNHGFWQAFHRAVKDANPNAVILAEHYGDPSPWLNGMEWDTVMNYDAFMEPLSWFLTGVSKHSEESRPALKNNAKIFENTMRYNMSYLNVQALQAAMNQLSNHDHSRFLTRTNGNIGRWHTVGPKAAGVGVDKNIMMAAIVFQMTWPGAPTIYYGDEAGLVGWTDPDNRRPFPWGREDVALTGLHKALTRMRKNYPVLRHGSVDFLLADGGVLAFGRWDDEQAVVVVINNGEKPMDVTVPVWRVGVFDGGLTELVTTQGNAFREPHIHHHINAGQLQLTMPACSAVVFGR